MPIAHLAGTTTGDDDDADSAADVAPVGVQQLVETLLGRVRLRQGAGGAASSADSGASSGSGSSGVVGGSRGAAPDKEPFLFYIDHCFVIRGQGTVMTGAPINRADLLSCCTGVLSAWVCKAVSALV
jgi:hypothetical protein